MDINTMVISLTNVKGGVGKTTISANISHILSRAGYKVLHIDMDPQGSSSELIKPLKADKTYLTKDEIIRLNLFNLLTQPVDPRGYIFKTNYENLDIIPNARGAELTFSDGSFDKRFVKLDYPNKDIAFKCNLDRLRGIYDYIIIDGQPGMNELMKISIIASDYVLSPALPDLFNLHTVDDTLKIIDLCNTNYGLEITYLGFFLNIVEDIRDLTYKQVREFYLNKAGEYFLDCPVRSSKSIIKAALNNLLWLDYAKEYSVITFPNPCKDLLKLMDQKLLLLEPEYKENLIKQGIKRSYFE